MSNGRIDAAQVEAILSAGREEIDRYLVSTLAVLIERVEALPAETDRKIAAHQTECRGQSRRTLYALLTAIGTCIGLATPYILEFFGG